MTKTSALVPTHTTIFYLASLCGLTLRPFAMQSVHINEQEIQVYTQVNVLCLCVCAYSFDLSLVAALLKPKTREKTSSTGVLFAGLL